MKFSCTTTALIDGLQIATKALPGHSTTNAILSNILVETNEDGVLLTCSDERLTIRTQIEATVTEHGRGLVPGKLFNDIVRRMDDGIVNVNMSARRLFRITSGESRANVAGQDADAFPALPTLNTPRTVSLPQDLLKEMIGRVEFAIAAEDMREVLTGGFLKIQNGEISMVGLDGFRMALNRAPISGDMIEFSAIIPGRALSDVGKLLSDNPEDFAHLSIDNKRLHIGLDGTDVYVLLIGGEYFDYPRIIPKSFGTRVVVDSALFRSCVERAALFARDGQNNLVILKLAENRMIMEGHSQVGDSHEELDCELTGAELQIAFNVKYLLDVVRYIDDERIVMQMNNAVQPCVMSPEGNGKYIHLILPIRTSMTIK